MDPSCDPLLRIGAHEIITEAVNYRLGTMLIIFLISLLGMCPRLSQVLANDKRFIAYQLSRFQASQNEALYLPFRRLYSLLGSTLVQVLPDILISMSIVSLTLRYRSDPVHRIRAFTGRCF